MRQMLNRIRDLYTQDTERWRFYTSLENDFKLTAKTIFVLTYLRVLHTCRSVSHKLGRCPT